MNFVNKKKTYTDRQLLEKLVNLHYKGMMKQMELHLDVYKVLKKSERLEKIAIAVSVTSFTASILALGITIFNLSQ